LCSPCAKAAGVGIEVGVELVLAAVMVGAIVEMVRHLLVGEVVGSMRVGNVVVLVLLLSSLLLILSPSLLGTPWRLRIAAQNVGGGPSPLLLLL
jgi:hypothetical protein